MALGPGMGGGRKERGGEGTRIILIAQRAVRRAGFETPHRSSITSALRDQIPKALFPTSVYESLGSLGGLVWSLGGLLSPLRAFLGASCGSLGPLLGPSWELLGLSWDLLCPLGCLLASLGAPRRTNMRAEMLNNEWHLDVARKRPRKKMLPASSAPGCSWGPLRSFLGAKMGPTGIATQMEKQIKKK